LTLAKEIAVGDMLIEEELAERGERCQMSFGIIFTGNFLDVVFDNFRRYLKVRIG